MSQLNYYDLIPQFIELGQIRLEEARKRGYPITAEFIPSLSLGRQAGLSTCLSKMVSVDDELIVVTRNAVHAKQYNEQTSHIKQQVVQISRIRARRLRGLQYYFDKVWVFDGIELSDNKLDRILEEILVMRPKSILFTQPWR